jgi:hypothetical protein
VVDRLFAEPNLARLYDLFEASQEIITIARRAA